MRRRIRRRARRRAVVWILWRIPALPLLAIAGALGALKAWESIGKVGLLLSPFFAVAALYVHVRDMVRVARSPVLIVSGEALGPLADSYDETTLAFEIGRKRDLLVDVDRTDVLTRDGTIRRRDAEPRCRALRTSRRVRRSLEYGTDVLLVVLDERAFEILEPLATSIDDADQDVVARDTTESGRSAQPER